MAFAITEPDAGSDVANLTCEAKLSEDGKHYIVNGEKKWITNGIWCDYFTTAVRTGGPGMNGVSVLLIERDQRIGNVLECAQHRLFVLRHGRVVGGLVLMLAGDQCTAVE